MREYYIKYDITDEQIQLLENNSDHFMETFYLEEKQKNLNIPYDHKIHFDINEDTMSYYNRSSEIL